MLIESQRTQITWQSLSVKIFSSNEEKFIIKNACGRIGPSTLTALIGPGGAGKTTLLNAIAGRLSKEYKILGKILCNRYKRDPRSWPICLGYIEKKLHLIENQTVYETILFAARMKLRVQDLHMKIYDHVEDIIQKLGLENLKTDYVNTLSDGELKYVYIGLELAGNPPILFLDEPIDCLDSCNAIKVIELLKHLAENGKNVFLTIRQPSEDIITFFDKIIIMVKGKEVCVGNTNECLEFYKNNGFKKRKEENPCSFFINILSKNNNDELGIHENKERIEKLKTSWINRDIQIKCCCPNATGLQLLIVPRKSKQLKYKISLYYILKRDFSSLIRNRLFIGFQLLQRIIFTIVMGFTFLQVGYTQASIRSRIDLMLFIIINAFFGVFGTILDVFPIEKLSIQRERRSNMYDD